MASSFERSSDSRLLKHRTEVSNEYSSASYPGDHHTSVVPVSTLKDISSLSEKDQSDNDVLQARVSYSEVMEQKISSLILDANSLQEDKPVEAISRLTKAIALDKGNAYLYELRARIYLSSGDFPSAIVNFRKALSLVQQQQQSSDNVLQSLLCSVYFIYIQNLYDLGCYQEALEVLQASSWLHQFNLQFNLRRIMCLSAMSNHDKCLEVINTTICQHGQLPDLLIMRARINYMFGNLSQCYYDITNVLCCHGDNLEANQLREQLEQQANITRGQAIDYYLEGKNCESLKKITAAIDTDPSTGGYHVFRGVLLRLMADYTNAIDELLLAMDKCHHDISSSTYQNASRQLLLTINDFAVYCYRQGQYADAVVLLNKAIADNQHEQGLYINRGDCFYRMRKLNYALSDYQQAEEVLGADSDHKIAVRIAQVSYELGKVAFNRDDKEDAIHWLSLAIHHCPQVAAFYTARARAHFALKDVLSAQNDLITSLKLGENEQNCYSILARLFPGQTAASVMTQHSPVKKEITTHHITSCSSSTATMLRHLATPPLREVGVARQWELLSRPLPPIMGDKEWSDEERQFHCDINQIKKKDMFEELISLMDKSVDVTKQVKDVLTEVSSFPPLSPVIPSDTLQAYPVTHYRHTQ